MDPHRITIQSIKAPLFSDLEDDTSPPKKRGKHGSDLRVLDFDLPKRKRAKGNEWHQLFQYQYYKPVSPGLSEDLSTKCKEEIKALKKAYNKAKRFFDTEFADLEEKQSCPITRWVLKTIIEEEEVAYDRIRKAENMLISVEADVVVYLDFNERVLLKCKLANDAYFNIFEELAKNNDVGKMIKYLMCGPIDYERIEEISRFTPLEMCYFVDILKPQINFDIKDYNEDEEQFGRTEMTKVLEDIKGSMENIYSLRVAYVEAAANAKKFGLIYSSDSCPHIWNLVGYLRTACVQLELMRDQLNLLYEKNVIENGYYIMFEQDWLDACWSEVAVE